MPKPRKSHVSLEATPYGHCIPVYGGRFCVGRTSSPGARLSIAVAGLRAACWPLGKFFAVDIAAYAVMSNHIHLVVRLNKKGADDGVPLEVIERWHRLFTGTHKLIQTRIAR